ncbi:hypothetical protein AVEN_76678-1 [Araneus ventricosus]|uniref:Uncharacterized protein n=1 Tax=Araneus ventricosus TaxID=182803 RepID=A0A4Y2BR64_ARAVE|nr:hypothetical protein AVEN_76678-1 [Araneus ventricosus]
MNIDGYIFAGSPVGRTMDGGQLCLKNGIVTFKFVKVIFNVIVFLEDAHGESSLMGATPGYIIQMELAIAYDLPESSLGIQINKTENSSIH